jgi:uncharacterized membrane protein YqjE
MARAEQQTLSEALTRVVDATARLVTENVRLARVELEGQARHLARSSVWFAIALGLGGAGYGLFCAAAALSLASRFGWEPTLWALAGVNLVGGAFLSWRGMKKVSQRPRRGAPAQRGLPGPTTGAPALPTDRDEALA